MDVSEIYYLIFKGCWKVFQESLMGVLSVVTGGFNGASKAF